MLMLASAGHVLVVSTRLVIIRSGILIGGHRLLLILLLLGLKPNEIYLIKTFFECDRLVLTRNDILFVSSANKGSGRLVSNT